MVWAAALYYIFLAETMSHVKIDGSGPEGLLQRLMFQHLQSQSNQDIGNARRSRHLGSGAAKSALAPIETVEPWRFWSAQIPLPSICHLSRACDRHGVTYGPPLVHVPQHSPRRR